MSKFQLQAVKGLTSQDLKSITTYISSVRYMRKIVPRLVINIIYNRVEYENNLFVDNPICNISFKAIKSGIKNHALADVFWWCKGVVDAIQKKYLKEMHLLFIDKAKNNIEEDYKFTFKYESKPDTTVLPKSEDVIRMTQRLFESIDSLANYQKMDKDIRILIEMAFFDDVAPENYDPPHFIRPAAMPMFLQMSQKMEYESIGHLKTGYHKLKCAVKGSKFSIESRANSTIMEGEMCDVDMDEDEVEVNQNPKNRSKNNDIDKFNSMNDDEEILHFNRQKVTNADDLISVHSNETESIDFYCPCEQNINIEFSDKIKCAKCFKHQHLLCLGYVGMDSIEMPYFCPYCTAIQNKSFDKFLSTDNQDNWKTVSCSRLFLYHCYKFKEVPLQLLEMIDLRTRKAVLKLVKDKKLMKIHRESTTVKLYESMIDTVMQLFVDLTPPHSMQLDDDIKTMDLI